MTARKYQDIVIVWKVHHFSTVTTNQTDHENIKAHLLVLGFRLIFLWYYYDIKITSWHQVNYPHAQTHTKPGGQ